MLFYTPQEINHIIPTAKFKSIDNLISRLNAEEMSSLYPLIGMELLQALNADYDKLRQDDGGIWSCAERSEEDTTKVTILRTAQEVLLYSYLANHSAILQSSFNMGGGWNKPSTGDYEALDPKDNDRLDKDLWHSARRAKENLLLYLEMDARAKQVYTEAWKNSDYFYQHSDLLFTTSSELHPLYINLGDTPHLNFQAYISTLHDCQDGYIAGTIGYPLLQALIDRKYQPAEPTPDTPDNPESPESPENPELSTLNSQLSTWQTLDRHIRTSLANFTAYEMDGAKHDHLRNRGQSQLSIATKFIHAHYETFSEYIPKDVPIYVPPKPEPNADDPHPHHHHHHKEHPCPPPPHRGTVFSLLH